VIEVWGKQDQIKREDKGKKRRGTGEEEKESQKEGKKKKVKRGAELADNPDLQGIWTS
jgi:hypothetical protein